MFDRFKTRLNLHNYENVPGHNSSDLSSVFEGVEIGEKYPLQKVIDKNGNTWYELDEGDDGDMSYYQADQMFLTRILKGILPVSDIVCVKDKNGENRFFSKEIPDFEFPKPEFAYDKIYINCETSMTAEDFILFYIFRDSDHHIHFPQHNSVYKRFPFRVNTQSIFDFEGAVSFWSDSSSFYGFVESVTFSKLSESSKKAILYYIDKLKARFSGDAFEDFVNKVDTEILNTTGESPWVLNKEKGRTVDKYVNELLSRLNNLENKIR
jgi:hypothetical protein